MDNLNDIKKMAQLDKQNVSGSIESLGLQCQQAWDEVKKVKIPGTYRHVKNILINGMGGSALGGHIIESLYIDKLKVPFRVINSYNLPGWVNTDTLCILSSYSGTTEEVLATFQAARRKKAKLLVICAGGKLAALARQYKLPAYIFNPLFNPCNQPRMGLGYSIIGQLALLRQCGLLTLNENEFKKAVQQIISLHRRFGVRVPLNKNAAKQAARALTGRIPVIVAAGHLSGNAHVLANQINENSKNFSAYFLQSELNHHLMEGLKFPRSNRHILKFIFIDSNLYLPKIQQRSAIAKKVLTKNNITFIGYKATGRTLLEQVFEVLLFGSYVNYYLALVNGVNPSLIPYVDYFKKELEKKA